MYIKYIFNLFFLYFVDKEYININMYIYNII